MADNTSSVNLDITANGAKAVDEFNKFRQSVAETQAAFDAATARARSILAARR